MKALKGIQHFTTGNPDRSYSHQIFDYYHPTRDFSRRQTSTSSQSLPSVIAYLVLENQEFFNRYALKNNDGTYRTKDSYSLTREQINEMHKDNTMMRSIVNLLNRKDRYFKNLVSVSVNELGIDEDLVKADLGYLIVNGVIGYNVSGKLSANKKIIDPTAFTRMLDPWAKERNKGKKKSDKKKKAMTMPCSF